MLIQYDIIVIRHDILLISHDIMLIDNTRDHGVLRALYSRGILSNFGTFYDITIEVEQ